jgi:hypothetical protein
MLRHPRAHIFSQYLECKYDDWGKNMTKLTMFPREGSDETGLNKWLDHFLKEAPSDESNLINGEDGDFRCYNPWNMQSRYLTRGRPGFMKGDPKYAYLQYLPAHHTYSTEDRVPSPVKAAAHLENFAWVGIVQLFHESLCLLEFQFNGKLPGDCICSLPRSTVDKEDHETHHVPPHDAKNLTKETQRKIDQLSVIDAAVYSHALGLVLKRIQKLESALGSRIICAEKLHGIRLELGYLPSAVAAIECYTRGFGSSECASQIHHFPPSSRLGSL